MESIQPIVLAGGRSVRFGRDKLRERVGTREHKEMWLIDRPIATLREAFGPCVAVVGQCDPEVASRADLVLPDAYPGAGPAGGILSALEHCGRSLFVLAGDLAAIDSEVVRSVLRAGANAPAAAAVLARTDRIEPCIGLYRPSAAAVLRAEVTAAARGRTRPLHMLIRTLHVVEVEIDPALARNVNTPEELGTFMLDRPPTTHPTHRSANRE